MAEKLINLVRDINLQIQEENSKQDKCKQTRIKIYHTQIYEN